MLTDIHIFSPGTQTSAQGVTREFTVSDLKQVADTYTPELHEAPIRIGHEDSDKVPSWGWVKNVKMKGDDLYAEVEFSPLMDDYVQNGLYKKVSASFYSPESKINPDPGKWSLRHVAMLGAQPPAVKGLKGFAYSEESEVDGVLDFAVEMKLTPDQVFDEELGPTIREEQSPLEQLKVKLDEARTEMAQEEKRKEELGQAEEDLKAEGIDVEAMSSDEDFAEEDMKKKSAKKAKQGAEDAEEEVEGDDDVQSKEKMDPVGKEDSDVDNDGDSDSSDEYLKKRRAAIKKSMKDDKSDNSEEDSVDHAGSCGSKKKNYKEGEEGEDSVDNEEYETADGEGPVAGKVKKSANDGKSELNHSEIAVPEGMDAAQWEAGFKDAVSQYYTAAQEGADEVVHQETEEQTADYLAGIEAGFEFAQSRVLSDGKDLSAGSNKHDDKCCNEDEEAEGQGPEASKVKKNAKDGESEVKDQGQYGEATFEDSKKKRGHDNDKSSDVGVKAQSSYEETDEEQHGEGNDDFGRDEVGKPGSGGQTGRNKKGKGKSGDLGTQAQADEKGSDGGAQDKTRAAKGTGKPPKANGGKSKDVQSVDGVELKPATDVKKGSGAQIKSPSVRVMKIGNYAETSDFSELTARLAELEAANAKLVQEKIAAERAAHRMQLEEFAESLFSTGRLTPAVCEAEELVDYMEGLEYGTLEFAEGESAATKLMELLAALPAQVSYSEVVTHDDEAIPADNLNPHEQALRMSKEEGMDYAEALKQTLFSTK